MIALHEKYPGYGWNQNKGYPTTIHRKALSDFGITPFHRKSFKLFDAQLSIDFGEE
jgi:ribonuclease HII